MATNKFNFSWQLVRTKARKISNINEKISYILRYLDDNKNCHNYDRVMNWLRMTSLAYKDRSLFNVAIAKLVTTKTLYLSTIDTIANLEDIDKEDILLVVKDLSRRKYNFRFNGKIPEAHKKFIADITSHL